MLLLAMLLREAVPLYVEVVRGRVRVQRLLACRLACRWHCERAWRVGRGARCGASGSFQAPALVHESRVTVGCALALAGEPCTPLAGLH